MCDLAVLVVDIMHGLEPQTIESLNMLRSRKTPFVIALNKCDRMFDWEVHTDSPMQESLQKQKKFVSKEFETRSREVLLAFAEEGLNAALYWENPDPRTFVNVIPTSAHTGEGMPDLLQTLVHLSQSRLNERIRFIVGPIIFAYPLSPPFFIAPIVTSGIDMKMTDPRPRMI